MTRFIVLRKKKNRTLSFDSSDRLNPPLLVSYKTSINMQGSNEYNFSDLLINTKDSGEIIDTHNLTMFSCCDRRMLDYRQMSCKENNLLYIIVVLHSGI